MKICSKCKQPRPIGEFRHDPRYAMGLYCWCNICVAAYNRSPERKKRDRDRRRVKFSNPAVRAARNEAQRAKYATPKEKRRHKNEMYQRKYGISLEFFESEVKKQKSCCKLCNQIRELVSDHNHKTKKYRGAICRLCNVAVGRIESVSDFISKVQEYIQ
jgi:recombination endonuclease VII